MCFYTVVYCLWVFVRIVFFRIVASGSWPWQCIMVFCKYPFTHICQVIPSTNDSEVLIISCLWILTPCFPSTKQRAKSAKSWINLLWNNMWRYMNGLFDIDISWLSCLNEPTTKVQDFARLRSVPKVQSFNHCLQGESTKMCYMLFC